MATYYVDNANGNDGNSGLSEALAWASLAHAADTVAAGDTVYIQSGTSYTVQDGANGANMVLGVAGTAGAPITWVGYTTTITDQGIAVIDAGSGWNYAVDASLSTFQIFRNLQFKGGSSDGVYCGTADYFYFMNCTFSNNGGQGLQLDNDLMCVRCTFHTNLSGAVIVDNESLFIGCVFYSNTGNTTLDSDLSCNLINCLFYANTHTSAYNIITTDGRGSSVVNCTIDGENNANSTGIYNITNPHLAVVNTVIYDCNVGIGADADYGAQVWEDYNLINDNTTPRSNVGAGPNTLTTAPAFANEAGDDYTPGSSSPMLAAGLDGGQKTAPGISYIDIGGIQRQSGAGGGGLLTHTGMTGGIRG